MNIPSFILPNSKMFCAERRRLSIILKLMEEIRLKFNSEFGRLCQIIAVVDIFNFCTFLKAIWKG